VSDETFETNYVEVWNKIDLLAEDLQEDGSEDVVLMSATKGLGKDAFLERVFEKTK